MLTISLHQRKFVLINRWKFQLNSMFEKCSTISYWTTWRWIFESNINHKLNIFRSENDQNLKKRSNRHSTENLLILRNRSWRNISHRNEKNIDNIGFFIVDFQPSIYLHEEMFEWRKKEVDETKFTVVLNDFGSRRKWESNSSSERSVKNFKVHWSVSKDETRKIRDVFVLMIRYTLMHIRLKLSVDCWSQIQLNWLTLEKCWAKILKWQK